ncbi:MAG: isocitrate lyase/PEP mutase family protein [Rhodospirillales bacterium]|nr:isocitrate lyase/PEP mutase family protein [Rhodospirillales bacterium]
MTSTKEFRRLLAQNDIIRAPGVYDGITSRLVEQAGFPAVYMTGAGTSMSLGYPDFGLVTQTEMVANAAVIARTVGIPVISDADTGYGNELNVTRTVNEYERAGVAAIHIEDQVMPKRCGHLDGKEIVPLDEYVAKIRAAAAARKDPDFVIIARTDARAVTSFEDAIERANAALSNGADVAFVEAVRTMEEMSEVPKLVKGPCLLNIVSGGLTPDVTLGEARDLGYKIAIMPSLLTSAIFDTCDSVLARVKESDAPAASTASSGPGQRFNRFHGEYWNGLRTKFH